MSSTADFMTGSVPAAADLTAMEIATGIVLGLDHDAVALPRARGTDLASALETSVLPALRRPPCVVSFSGGRDSSGVLAAAAGAARKHGLPLPVPVTLRFPDAPESAEREWQEFVVRSLELPDWQWITFTGELDIVGPYASRVLRRHGPLWPYNAYLHTPVFERAAGGSVLTGAGGDELLSPGDWLRVGMLRAARARPRPSDVGDIALAIAPRALRAAVSAKSVAAKLQTPWLRPAAQRRFDRMLGRHAAAVNVRFDRSLRDSWWRSRYRRYMVASLGLLGSDYDVVVRHPLQDRRVLLALAERGGAGGYWSRSAAMRDLFGELLPHAVTARRTKALFDTPLWNRHVQEFLSRWDGSGVDSELIDADALRALWKSDGVSQPLSWLALQVAWLRSSTRI